ncbi:MAG: DUF4180 domain-containing protein [Saprospiraceae bacterium]|nr:DUF4180 domain-containing protein [Saprospiraceae bacterium]MBK7811424.1 DUF4180 domain-containing protein [Saprospiraceae bacterium]MBK9631326.1 DUF4180 domain-containing protein [Saprospiraceae bacterium]
MEIIRHQVLDTAIAEIVSDEILIHNAEDGLNILVDVYYQDFDYLILHANNITPTFFHLKSGLAGEILQKFSNYRMKLAIVGNFVGLESKSLNEFIRESNKSSQIYFVNTLAEALSNFSK